MAGLLIKTSGDGAGLRQGLAGVAAKGRLEKILDVPGEGGGQGVAATRPASWHRLETDTQGAAALWSEAHGVISSGAGGGAVLLVEPDLSQQWHTGVEGDDSAFGAAAKACAFEDQSKKGGQTVVKNRKAWNLDPDFSDLKRAREAVTRAEQERVRIAHLDTGYDPHHRTLPVNLLTGEFRNFVDPSALSAEDVIKAGQPLTNRGHGTSTLGLLAGNRVDDSFPGWNGFDDFIGGIPYAHILPMRVADAVVIFSTGHVVAAFDAAIKAGAHVLSMSFGGLASRALADAVNAAYDAGLMMVTAAGNNYPAVSPSSIVFPARFKRVLAACGVMGDGRAYYGLDFGTMQGNWGPMSKMETALGAFTPNVPWARLGCPDIVDMCGGGTSAATPQIAAAAGLYLAKHFDTLMGFPEPWMRVEAIRRALFGKAAKMTAAMDGDEARKKIGEGVLKAFDALGVQPTTAGLVKQKRDSSDWSWLKILAGTGFSAAGDDPRTQMIKLELTQLAQKVRAVDEAMPDTGLDTVPETAIQRYFEAVLDSGQGSQPMRRFCERYLGVGRGAGKLTLKGTPVAGAAATSEVRRAQVPPKMPPRRLRVFALDPSLGKRLDTVSLTTTTLSVPWEHDLKPGPVGDYVEVVDIDPSSNRVYAPVDLNANHILAADGLEPSEGDPQFHQQMVYAVAMTTIGHFEKALGRRALWSPVKTQDGKYEFRHMRLRLYPHALRTQNAYYSPVKKAIEFGYFPAGPEAGDSTPPNSLVFSCLSSDIIAHETCHALLDGLHRRYQDPTNPDVPAFHEAFADIVAMFQHFTMRELVRADIAQAHGDLSAARLLGGLARQFGEGAGYRGPLRDYIDKPKKEGTDEPLTYLNAEEAHERGSVLVYAIYEAFLAVVNARSHDLIRLASGGTGILPDGAIHPDLVGRLTEEACKTARHFLQIFIRALDYCPPVDITFGDYLRAVITSDRDLVEDDRYGYRVAIIEAFRKYKIMPRDVRTVSEQSLAWKSPLGIEGEWVKRLLYGDATRDTKLELRWDRSLDLEEIYKLNNSNKYKFWTNLSEVLRHQPGLCSTFGLVMDLPKYDEQGRETGKATNGVTNFEVHSVRPARRISPDGEAKTDIVAVINQRRPVFQNGNFAFWFRGGATLIFDGTRDHETIRYSIIKSTASLSRADRQNDLHMSGAGRPSGLRALYFDTAEVEPFAMTHAHDDGE